MQIIYHIVMVDDAWYAVIPADRRHWRFSANKEQLVESVLTLVAPTHDAEVYVFDIDDRIEAIYRFTYGRATIDQRQQPKGGISAAKAA